MASVKDSHTAQAAQRPTNHPEIGVVFGDVQIAHFNDLCARSNDLNLVVKELAKSPVADTTAKKEHIPPHEHRGLEPVLLFAKLESALAALHDPGDLFTNCRNVDSSFKLDAPT